MRVPNYCLFNINENGGDEMAVKSPKTAILIVLIFISKQQKSL
jgi:hypothetical protein